MVQGAGALYPAMVPTGLGMEQGTLPDSLSSQYLPRGPLPSTHCTTPQAPGPFPSSSVEARVSYRYTSCLVSRCQHDWNDRRASKDRSNDSHGGTQGGFVLWWLTVLTGRQGIGRYLSEHRCSKHRPRSFVSIQYEKMHWSLRLISSM